MGGGYTLALATDQFHSGKQSIHIMAPTATGQAQITATKGFPVAEVWGRAWLRFMATTGGHQMYIAHNVSGDQVRVLNRLGGESIQVNFQKSDKFYASKMNIPNGTWFCYEWHVTASTVEIYLNGTKLSEIAPTMGATGNMTNAILGYQRFQAGNSAGEMWIDDVGFDSKQIGCN